MQHDLVSRLRALARCEHDDYSIGDEAAEFIEHFHAPDESAIRADERERCAKIAEDYDFCRVVYTSRGEPVDCMHGKVISDAIRAGGAK